MREQTTTTPVPPQLSDEERALWEKADAARQAMEAVTQPFTLTTTAHDRGLWSLLGEGEYTAANALCQLAHACNPAVILSLLTERETPYPPCAYCGGSPWEHEAATTGRTICRQYRSRIVDGAAAPAAEGPRNDTRVETGSDNVIADLGLPHAAERMRLALRARAGAEVTNAAVNEMRAANDRLRAKNHELNVRATKAEGTVAALASEVRALREDAERWRVLEPSMYVDTLTATEGHYVSSIILDDLTEPLPTTPREFVALLAARLASPSPTGAP